MSSLMLCPWTGKVVRFTRKAAKELCKKDKTHGFYHCIQCGFWHLFSKKPKKRR